MPAALARGKHSPEPSTQPSELDPGWSLYVRAPDFAAKFAALGALS
jgi:hypothetical protein